MSANVFYSKLTALDKEKHRDVKLHVSNNFSAFSSTNALPIAGVEFIEAAREHVIAFIDYMDEGIIPVYVLGVRDNENLVVTEDGKWKYRYVPAFVRRYPFIMLEPDENGRSIVCIDENYPGLNSTIGQPLFNDKGEPGEQLKKAMEMLEDYHAQMARTQQFTKKLVDYELLEPFTPQLQTGDGQTFSLSGMLAINEQKLLDLEQEKALDLYRSGELAWVYNHLSSLSNLLRFADFLTISETTAAPTQVH